MTDTGPSDPTTSLRRMVEAGLQTKAERESEQQRQAALAEDALRRRVEA